MRLQDVERLKTTLHLTTQCIHINFGRILIYMYILFIENFKNETLLNRLYLIFLLICIAVC